MQDTYDTNLVMSDEEVFNGVSPRSDQRTLSNQVSPKTDSKFLNTQELLSPIPEQKETLPTYPESDRHNEYGNENHAGKGNDSFATPRSAQYNPGNDYENGSNSNDENNINNIRKLINEARTAENDYEGYDNTKDSQSNRRQGGHNDKLASTHPDMFQKRGDQKYEIGIMYNKINPKDVDHQQNNDEYQNLREVQSTKNITSTPGQMRLSKMSEEDAATVFESRKREILSTLLKKGHKGGKKPIAQSTANERGRGASQEKKGEFIIYNQKNITSPSGNGAAPSGKKDDIVNKLLEKERDPSQSARKILLDGSGNKNKFMTPKVTKNQMGRTFETPQDTNKEENKIVVDLKKSNSKTSQASGRRTPLADKQYTKMTVSSKSKEFNSNINTLVASPQLRGVSPAHTNQTSRRTPFSAEQTISSPKYEAPREDGPQIKTKNREILNEINDLDAEIYKLAQESNLVEDETESYKDKYNKRPTLSNTNQSHESGRKTPPATRSVYSNYKPARKTETNEQTPSVHSEDNRANPKKRTHSDLPNDVNNPMPSIKDQLNQSYSSLGTRKFSHHHEYLYERGMVKMIAQNDISVRTQRFKEQESLRDCTFSPDIGSNTQRKNEDIITKTRKWQAEKERQMVIQERAKVAREMAECTFSPNGSQDKPDLKFPEKYYEKSLEWQKKVEENRQKKQEELYHSIMSNPEKSRNTSFNLSRMTDPNRTGLKSQGSSSNKQISTKISSETISSPKSNSSPKSGYYVPRQARGEFKLKTKSATEEHHPNQSNNSQVQSQIAESYALLDGLQQFVNIKKELNEKIDNKSVKASTPKPENEKENKVFLRGVAANPSQTPTQMNGSYRTLSKQKAPVKAEPTPQPVEQQQQNIPIITLEGYDKNYLSQNVHKLVVKNNRYVVDDTNTSQELVEDANGRSNTKDSAQKNKREPSPKPNSPRKPSNRYDPVAKTNLGTNGLTSPTTQSLENKYFDLLGKVNKVTKQLSQVKAENKNLQKDINSIQNNNIKNSLYS